MPQVLDLDGQTFGRLTVIRRTVNGSGGHSRWLCRCSCGAETEVFSQALRAGTTRSCGCLQRELTSLDGHRRSVRRFPRSNRFVPMGGVDREFDL